MPKRGIHSSRPTERPQIRLGVLAQPLGPSRRFGSQVQQPSSRARCLILHPGSEVSSDASLTPPGGDLAFPLPGRFVAPGGFFDWYFYGDSYFTVLGLTPCGQWQLARELVDGFVASIEEFGMVANYNSPETICRSRSQPPFLTDAILGRHELD